MTDRHRHPPIRLRSNVAAQLPSPTSAAASTALERYFWLLEQGASTLTAAEVGLSLCACINLSLVGPPELVAQAIATEVEEAIAADPNLSTEWGVDGPDLLAKLRAAGPAGGLALAQMVEKARSHNRSILPSD